VTSLRINSNCYLIKERRTSDSKQIVFILRDEAVSFGNRLAGPPVRNRLANLLSMAKGSKVIVDFRDVPLVSSGFADDIFGKLFVEIGSAPIVAPCPSA